MTHATEPPTWQEIAESLAVERDRLRDELDQVHATHETIDALAAELAAAETEQNILRDQLGDLRALTEGEAGEWKRLIEERDRLRSLVGAVEVWGTGYIWRQPDGKDIVIHPAEVTVMVSPGAIAAEKAVVAAARHVRALRRGTMLNPDEVYRALDAAVDALDGA